MIGIGGTVLAQCISSATKTLTAPVVQLVSTTSGYSLNFAEVGIKHYKSINHFVNLLKSQYYVFYFNIITKFHMDYSK
jgi:hypothetical protein